MARLVRRTETGPIKIEPQDKPVWVCGCGLSRSFPFCDGAHKACSREEEGVLYEYDADNNCVVSERIDTAKDGPDSNCD